MPRRTYSKEEKIEGVTLAKFSGISYASWKFSIPRRTLKAWIEKKIPDMSASEVVIAKFHLEIDKENLMNRVKELELANEELRENNVIFENIVKEIQHSAEKANQIIKETAV